MSRPMIVITSSSVVTCLGWWEKFSVEGNAVVLSSPSAMESDGANLVVAEVRSEAEAGALFRTINHRIVLGARRFDVLDEWPGSIRRGDGDDVAGGRSR
ncbi:MAG: hypothetical protein M3P18_17895 [Actinomycetota bacterium]|nr:hypothetical protein [Actinomycetota bacterium]